MTEKILPENPPSQTETGDAPVIDEAWIARFGEWNLRTFGPGLRTAGTIDHIRKECREIEANPTDPKEWVDIILLGINGLVRQGCTPAQIIAEIHGKHEINETRVWPDWRGTDPDKAIEHDRSKDAFPDTFDRLKAIIVECVGVNDWTSITPDADLTADVGLDSLDTVEIVMAAEEHFGVEIDDGDIAVVVTMQDAVNAVDKARAALAASEGKP